MDDKNRLSFSAFQCYAQCPLKYRKVYIDRIKEPTNKYTLFGIAIHSLLENIYTHKNFDPTYAFKMWGTILLNEATKSKNQHITKSTITELDSQGKKFINNFFILAKKEGILKAPIGVEDDITAKYRDRVIRAKIDLIIDIDGKLYIVDWKTGSEEPKNINQLALYAAIWSKKNNHKIDGILLVYLKGSSTIKKDFDATLNQEAGKYFRTLYDKLIVDNEFQPKRNKYCYNCFINKRGDCPLF